MKIVRWSGISILLVITAFLWALLTIWVNLWLDESIKTGGSELNGASVDLDDVSLAWTLDGLQLKGLQIADPLNLERNRLELGELDFSLSIASLLQSKFHVDSLKVSDLRFDQPRQQPAKKITPTKLTDATQWEWPKAVAADIQNIDTNDVLKQVGLTSPEKFATFSEELSAIPEQWEAQRQELPNEKTLEELELRSKKLKQRLKEANTFEKVVVLKDIRAFVKDVKNEQQKLSNFKNQVSEDIKFARNQWRDLQGQVAKDVSLAKSIISLSPDGVDHLAARLLGENLSYWVRLIFNQTKTLRRSVNNNEQPKPLPRAGIDVALSDAPILPRFWISQTELSGAVKLLEQSGTVEGKLVNIGSALIEGKPLNGQVQMTFDATSPLVAPSSFIEFNAKRVESDVAAQGKFILTNWPISRWQVGSGEVNLSDFKLNSQLEIVLDSSSTILTIDTQLADFKIEKSSDMSQSVRQFVEVLEQTNSLELTVQAHKIDDNMEIRLTSNLDKLFSQKVKQRVDSEVAKVEAELREAINARTREIRGKIEQQLGGLLDAEALLKQQLAQLDGIAQF